MKCKTSKELFASTASCEKKGKKSKMTVFDWWGFVGTGIQSVFAWVGFNRDAFADNVAMRQAQKYQQKNYQISWIAVARDDIRDMMGISVNRINNYMIVATLILSVAAGAVTSVTFNESCPTFVLFAFYMSLGISLIYLMLSIMFGVKGQNSAFGNTMKLLTYQVRPENPAEYNHNYLQQVQWIEKQGMKAMFRMPGVQPKYNTSAENEHARSAALISGKPIATANAAPSTLRGSVHKSMQPRTFAGIRNQGPAKNDRVPPPAEPGTSTQGSVPASTGHVNLEDTTPLESLFKRTEHTWYLAKFQQFMRLWHPYDTYSKYSMGLGIICLGQGTAYMSLGKLVGEERFLSAWGACVLTFAFVYMVLLVTMANFRGRLPWIRVTVIALLTAAPTLGAIGAVVEEMWVRQIVVPLCFLLHSVFWSLALYLAMQELHHDAKSDAVQATGGFWGQKKADGVEGQDGIQQCGPPDDVAPSQGTGFADVIATCEQGPVSSKLRDFGDGEISSAPRGWHDNKITKTSDGVSDHWPTDDQEFDAKAQATNSHIKNTVRYTLLTTAVLWFAMFLWSAAKFWVDPLTLSVHGLMGDRTTGSAEEVIVSWPNPLFRPRSLACSPDGSVYATDGFRIFRVVSRGANKASEISCTIGRPILDIAIACDSGGGCRPLALVPGGSGSFSASDVIDCIAPGKTISLPLLQDEWPAEFFTVKSVAQNAGNVTDHRLLSFRDREVLQFSWSGARNGWLPEWSMGALDFFSPREKFSEDSPGLGKGDIPVGISASPLLGGPTVFFRSTRSTQRSAIESRDSATWKLLGRWRVPPDVSPIAAGCALSSTSAIVLSAASLEHGRVPELFKLWFTI